MLTVKQKELAMIFVETLFEIEHYGTGQNILGKEKVVDKLKERVVSFLHKHEPNFDEQYFNDYIEKRLETKNNLKAYEDVQAKL